jgi:hypothetical protein
VTQHFIEKHLKSQNRDLANLEAAITDSQSELEATKVTQHIFKNTDLANLLLLIICLNLRLPR